MDPSRRRFFSASCAAGLGILAGCVALLTDPEPPDRFLEGIDGHAAFGPHSALGQADSISNELTTQRRGAIEGSSRITILASQIEQRFYMHRETELEGESIIGTAYFEDGVLYVWQHETEAYEEKYWYDERDWDIDWAYGLSGHRSEVRNIQFSYRGYDDALARFVFTANAADFDADWWIDDPFRDFEAFLDGSAELRTDTDDIARYYDRHFRARMADGQFRDSEITREVFDVNATEVPAPDWLDEAEPVDLVDGNN